VAPLIHLTAGGVQMLRDNGIQSVAVLSAKKEFEGCFSVTDVLKALVRTLRLEHKRQSFDMEGGDAAAALAAIFRGPVAKVMHAGDLWYLQQQDSSVLDAIKDMLKRRVRGPRSACAHARRTR
jgi:hypothetical protein